ncbi:DUF4259 domain-containing protein [Spirillospora sp. CA-253888]
MGTWGPGAFDNDDAADFAGELDTAPREQRVGLLRAALEAQIREDEFAEAVAVGAVAIVASQCPGGEPTDPIYGPNEQIPTLAPELRLLAVQALDRVIDGRTAVSPVWYEGDSGMRWRAMVGRLRSTLAAALEDPNQTKLPL